jgi:dihydrofolate synthase/folylpolyglutamate synthase
VSGWAERIRVGGREADVERAIERVRPQAVSLEATQFETLTAAALLAFADAGVEAAAVEAGLGGRHDATNVLVSPVQVLTNVALEHVDVLGSTREAIAEEKLAVVRPGATVVLGEPEWERLASRNGAARVVVELGGNEALGGAAVAAFLGRPVEPVHVQLPGRLDRHGDEIWDGAHTPEAVRHIAARLPAIGSIVVSLLADKDVAGVLRELAGIAPILVATRSSNPRALPAGKLAECARPFFARVEVAESPETALVLAHRLGKPVLVTGSLYLLADLWPTAVRA